MKTVTKRRNAIARELFLRFRRLLNRSNKNMVLTPEQAWRVMHKEEKSPWLEQADIAINAYLSIPD